MKPLTKKSVKQYSDNDVIYLTAQTINLKEVIPGRLEKRLYKSSHSQPDY